MNEPKRTEPTHKLFDPNKETQLKWIDKASTDIRVRFAAIRAEQAQAEKSPRLKAVQSKRVRG